MQAGRLATGWRPIENIRNAIEIIQQRLNAPVWLQICFETADKCSHNLAYDLTLIVRPAGEPHLQSNSVRRYGPDRDSLSGNAPSSSLGENSDPKSS